MESTLSRAGALRPQRASTPTRRRRGVAITAAALGAIGLGAGSAGATSTSTTTTETVTQTVEIGIPGPAVAVDLFDPSLGTLIAVRYEVSADVMMQLCVENLSEAADSIVGGPIHAELAVTLADATANAAVAEDVPASTIAARTGGDSCQSGLDTATNTFPGTVSAPDLLFRSESTSDTANGETTDPAALAAWTASAGATTRPVTYTSSSNGDVTQPSEWDIFFIAEGTFTATVEYEYQPTTTSTTIAGATTTTPGATTTLPGTLPTTGASSSLPIAAIALGLIAVGLGAAVVGKRRLSN